MDRKRLLAAPPILHDPRVTCPLPCLTEPGLNPATSGHPRLGAPGQCQWEQARALICDSFCAQGIHTPLLLMAPHEHPPTCPLQQTTSQVIHQPDTSTPWESSAGWNKIQSGRKPAPQQVATVCGMSFCGATLTCHCGSPGALSPVLLRKHFVPYNPRTSEY